MSTLVTDCPRCAAQSMTFDVLEQNLHSFHHRWQHWHEVYSICRKCKCGSIFVVSQKETRDEKVFIEKRGLVSYKDDLNNIAKVEGFINTRHKAQHQPPLHVPPEIAGPFNEAATCLATECWNAAAAMFRTSIDLATRALLPAEEVDGLNKRTRRDLGLRLQWLFAHGRLAPDLEELSKCIREDGNDGVHAFNLKRVDAEDLLDFTTALLERLYTHPEKLRLAKSRRDERREKGK
jgi:hypothetical protein